MMRRTYGGTGQRWARTVSKLSQDRAGHVQYQNYHRTELGTYSIKSITGQRWARTVSKLSQDRAGHVQYQNCHRTALGTYSIKIITGQRWARTVSKLSQDSAGHVQYQNYHRTALGRYSIERVHQRTTLTHARADGHNIFTQSKSMSKSEE